MDREEFYTRADLCRLLQVTERTVDKLLARGEIRSYKIGGSRRIDPADLAHYLAAQRDAS
jgi:excisionase family DNA binding protein